MGCTVGELLHRVSARELIEWQAYFGLEPWGEERADLRSGIVASTIANVNRGKGQRALKPEDFMPYLQKERKESGQRPKPLSVMRAWFGDRVKRSPAADSDR